jgi:hypothetical protein
MGAWVCADAAERHGEKDPEGQIHAGPHLLQAADRVILEPQKPVEPSVHAFHGGSAVAGFFPSSRRPGNGREDAAIRVERDPHGRPPAPWAGFPGAGRHGCPGTAEMTKRRRSRSLPASMSFQENRRFWGKMAIVGLLGAGVKS